MSYAIIVLCTKAAYFFDREKSLNFKLDLTLEMMKNYV